MSRNVGGSLPPALATYEEDLYIWGYKNRASGKEYDLVSVSDTGVSICFRRGFMPVGDSVYIDSHIINASDIGESLAVVPEIEETAVIVPVK